jgi:hypothetical protein
MSKQKGSKALSKKTMKGTKGGIIAVLRFNPQPEPPGATSGDLSMRKAGGETT